MAYTAGNLALDHRGGQGNAKMFNYYTTDSVATVSAADYFLADYAHLNPGDIIEVTVVDAVAPSSRTAVTGYARLMVVTRSSSTVTTTETGAGAGSVVSTTASTLAVTAAAHAGRTVVVNSAVAIAVTLPAATGSGALYRFVIGVAATATAHTIAALGLDIIQGNSYVVTTTATNTEGFHTSATSDKITLDGTTQGGFVGDRIDLIDVKASTWAVSMFVNATGTEATPFSAT